MPSGAESVERPRILSDIMAKDVEVSILGAHSEIGRIRRAPLAVQILDFVFVPVKNESKGPLVGAMARIALDSHFSHHILWLNDRGSLPNDWAIVADDSSCSLPYPQSLVMHLQRFSCLRVIRCSHQYDDRRQVQP